MTEEDPDDIYIDISRNQVPVVLEESSKQIEMNVKTVAVKLEEATASSSANKEDTAKIDLLVAARNQNFRCKELINDTVPCWYTTNDEDRMIRHVRKVHRGENPFQCTMCDYSTYNKVLFEEHFRIHQGIKPFKCRFCPYKSVSKKNTKKHEQIHRPDNPLKCPECDFIGRHERSLRLHIKTHLPNIICNKCDFKAKDTQTMKNHKRMHVTKWFRCDICETRFAESKNLDIHKKRIKKCDDCDSLLCNKAMKSKHMSSAHGKPSDGALFTCAICHWSCSSRPRALLHLIHHPDQTTDAALGDLRVLRQYGIIR